MKAKNSVHSSWFTGHLSPVTRHPSRRRAGFTLIEILTVLAIMMVLSGIIAAGAKYALTKAARSRAEAEIATMETALENFKADNGFYPVSSTSRASTPPGTPTAIEYYNSTNLFTALAGLQPGTKAYMTFKSNQKRIETLSGKKNTYIVDPFGSPYNYYRAGMSPTYIATNSVTFDLWSYGPDGKNNTADDITNWKH